MRPPGQGPRRLAPGLTFMAEPSVHFPAFVRCPAGSRGGTSRRSPGRGVAPCARRPHEEVPGCGSCLRSTSNGGEPERVALLEQQDMGDAPPSPWCPDGHFDQGEGAAEAFDSDLGLVHVVNPVRRDILPEWLPRTPRRSSGPSCLRCRSRCRRAERKRPPEPSPTGYFSRPAACTSSSLARGPWSHSVRVLCDASE